ncbi:hypothetical protein U9M48_040893, partial [Paspalum notatum var. saurae]
MSGGKSKSIEISKGRWWIYAKAWENKTAVQWWEEWQLRVLALCSLGVQCYLALFASARKANIWPLFRFFIWLAYVSGDTLAMYALAMLFNRQSKVHQHQYYLPQNVGNRDLEVLWAPILLMHLGGQINISAYNIEDNELWRRHILTALGQKLFTAAYLELKRILEGNRVCLFLLGERKLTQKIIEKVNLPGKNEGLFKDAWRLAQELMNRLTDEETRWKVIKDVWVEMLCFSAGRCRGYLHAKSIGSGGEYLNFVSLLMSHAGLETFAEKQQRMELWRTKDDRVRIATQRVQEAGDASNQPSTSGTSTTPQGIDPVMNREESATTQSAPKAVLDFCMDARLGAGREVTWTKPRRLDVE